MPLFIFKHAGKQTTLISRSIIFFFQYLGELTDCIINRWSNVVWHHTVKSNLYVGATIVIPLIIITMLAGMSLAYSIHVVLTPYHIQDKAMIIAQTTLLRDFAPFTIGCVLCVHCGLNLIDKNHPSLNHPPRFVILETIIPLMVGINFTAVSLYTYVFSSFLLSVFITSYYIVHANMAEYTFRLAELINIHEIVSSLLKTLAYTTIASLVAGYYYYGVASKIITSRAAVSRVITRSLFWLIMVSVLFKLTVP